HGGGDGGQRSRFGGAARSIARRGNPSVGRSGLSRTERSDPGVRAAGPGLHPSALPLQGWGSRSGAGEEPDQVEGALEGGTRVCGDEAEVRICEATLSRTEEECHPTVRGVRAGESVLGAEKTVALGTGLARERRLLITGEPPKQAEDWKKPNPSACTGLAEHLLARRHGLIQGFPRGSSNVSAAYGRKLPSPVHRGQK